MFIKDIGFRLRSSEPLRNSDWFKPGKCNCNSRRFTKGFTIDIWSITSHRVGVGNMNAAKVAPKKTCEPSV